MFTVALLAGAAGIVLIYSGLTGENWKTPWAWLLAIFAQPVKTMPYVTPTGSQPTTVTV